MKELAISAVDIFCDAINKLENARSLNKENSSKQNNRVVAEICIAMLKTFCINLIGYPGPGETMYILNQLDMLDRMGHHVFFLLYSEWNLNRELSIYSLHDYIIKS